MKTYEIGSGTAIDDLKAILTPAEYELLQEQYGGSRLSIAAIKLLTPDTVIARIIGYERALYLATKLGLHDRGFSVQLPSGRFSPYGVMREEVEARLQAGHSVGLIARELAVSERTIYRYKARLIDLRRIDPNPERQARKSVRRRTLYRLDRVNPAPLPTATTAVDGDPVAPIPDALDGVPSAPQNMPSADELAFLGLNEEEEAKEQARSDVPGLPSTEAASPSEPLGDMAEIAADIVRSPSLDTEIAAHETAAHAWTATNRPKRGKRTAQ